MKSVVVLHDGKNIVTEPVVDVLRHGQPFVDQPIRVTLRVKPFDKAFALAVGRTLRDIEYVSHYERVLLRWVKKGEK